MFFNGMHDPVFIEQFLVIPQKFSLFFLKKILLLKIIVIISYIEQVVKYILQFMSCSLFSYCFCFLKHC